MALGLRELVEPVEERQYELVDRRKAQRDLGLDAGDSQDGEVAGACGGGVEEGRLADPRGAAEHDHAAGTAACSVEEPVEHGAFRRAAQQHRLNVAEPLGARRPSDAGVPARRGGTSFSRARVMRFGLRHVTVSSGYDH